MQLLNLPYILQTRRNHALEHATIHTLSARFAGRSFAGHSNPTGFILLGRVSKTDVESAVAQALARLQAGERQLAIHPGCGTNMAISLLLSGGLAWLAVGGSKRGRLWRIPFAVVLALLGFALARPLGPWVQARVTTEQAMGEMRIVSVATFRLGPWTIHQVRTVS
jgi:hypothetical protein